MFDFTRSTIVSILRNRFEPTDDELKKMCLIINDISFYCSLDKLENFEMLVISIYKKL